MEIAILILEQRDQEERIRALLEKHPYPLRLVESSQASLEGAPIDVVIMGLPKARREQKRLEELLARIRTTSPHVQLLLCVPKSIGSVDRRVRELGARSFLLKPFDDASFLSTIERVLASIQRRKERDRYERKARRVSRMGEIIGRSEAIEDVLRLLKMVSESATTSVLLLGETGTGKSLFAQTIHEMSERSSGPFIEIDCASLPDNLMESELFGYEPGAFTDAKTQKIGLIELGDGGTLFFDEVTEINLQTQAKLLKFLDSKRIRRLGGDSEIGVDARIIAASNRNIKEAILQNDFREDLFYRLNVVEIRVPPIRERKSDIEMIAKHYLNSYRKKFHKSYLEFAPEAVDLIQEYPWPGNVRELMNVIERAVLLCQDEVIRLEDLPIERKPDRNVISFSSAYDDFVVKLPPEGVPLDALERKVIEETLKQTGGNVLKASRKLSISRGALRYKMMKYKIDQRAFHKKALIKA